MATGSSNWTFDNATVEGAGECNDSLINTTWLDERMYPGQLVDRIVSPIWYLVGVTGQTHHHHFILPTNKNTTFNNTTEIQLAGRQKNIKFMKLAPMLYTVLLIYKHT